MCMLGVHENVQVQARLAFCHRLADFDAAHVCSDQHGAMACTDAFNQGRCAGKPDVICAVSPSQNQRFVQEDLGKHQKVLQGMAPAWWLRPLQLGQPMDCMHALKVLQG